MLQSAITASLKACIESRLVRSLIDFCAFSGVKEYKKLANESLRKYLGRKSYSSAANTLSTFNSMVQKKLKTDMNDPSSSSRIERLIIDYHTIGRESGCSIVLQARQNVAVSHVLCAIKPQSLQTCLGDDLQFSKYTLRKDFRGFNKHAIAVAAA